MDLIKKINTQDSSFFLIAGPCAVENEDLCFEIAEHVKKLTLERNIPYIFKASFKKANRTKVDSFTGIGDNIGLEIIKKVGDHFSLPTTTDIHESYQAAIAANFVDILQIPAFLSRQTDLLVAAAKTGKIISIKKGQFLSAASMSYSIEKVKHAGNNNIWLIERGNSFGYQDLVVDFTNIPKMQAFDVPVIMDCTHSLQQPNQQSGVTGGNPAMISTIAKAAIAIGANGLFIETHPRPNEALSDGANMLKMDQLEKLLDQLVLIRNAVKSG